MVGGEGVALGGWILVWRDRSIGQLVNRVIRSALQPDSPIPDSRIPILDTPSRPEYNRR